MCLLIRKSHVMISSVYDLLIISTINSESCPSISIRLITNYIRIFRPEFDKAHYCLFIIILIWSPNVNEIQVWILIFFFFISMVSADLIYKMDMTRFTGQNKTIQRVSCETKLWNCNGSCELFFNIQLTVNFVCTCSIAWRPKFNCSCIIHEIMNVFLLRLERSHFSINWFINRLLSSPTLYTSLQSLLSFWSFIIALHRRLCRGRTVPRHIHSDFELKSLFLPNLKDFVLLQFTHSVDESIIISLSA